MIEVRNITKRYGTTLAVDDVSFSVQRGEIVGFLGPNGAGKSTTMKVLTGYLAPSAGSASIGGHDIVDEPVAARSNVGYLPENTPLYEEMGVVDFLKFIASMQGVPAERRSARVDELIDLCDLSRMAHKDISELSKGYRQRVGLAQALIHDPPVLILDEPTSGLDPAQIVEIRALIRRISVEKAILLSTHILPEAQNTCDRILIINQGKLVGEGTPDELLRAAAGGEHYTVSLKGKPAAQLSAALSGLPKVVGVDTKSENGAVRFNVRAEGGTDLSESIFDLAVREGVKLTELSRVSTTLEDVFLKLTGLTHTEIAAVRDAGAEQSVNEPAAAAGSTAETGGENE